MARIDGKCALVTGGASGLGRAIAEKLAREGARVTLTDVDTDGGAKAAAEIGGNAQFVPQDVSNGDQWADVWAAASKDQPVDVLVNNAGITIMGSIEDVDYEGWRKTFDVDVDSVFWGCKTAIANMKQSGGGSIINIASAAGLRASSGLAAYNAAKASVIMLTQSVALHCGEQQNGIRCNVVAPGTIKTAIIDKVLAQVPNPDEVLKGFVASHPIGHLGEPDDIANIVLYLASDDSKFATGATFTVDGGLAL